MLSSCSILVSILLVLCVATTFSNHPHTLVATGFALHNPFAPKYFGGSGVGAPLWKDGPSSVPPEEWKPANNMVLVERLQPLKENDTTESGLYMPTQDLPRLHMCRVVAVGPDVATSITMTMDKEGTPTAISSLQPGDLVLAKDPWGIGPRDEEMTNGVKLSYMLSTNIAAKVASVAEASP